MPKTIHHQDLDALWGDEDHLQIAQKRSFVSLIFEMLIEKVPTAEELKVFELILNLSIDHGPETPSAVEVIKAARDGKTISESVAEGIEMISDTHGGAIEPAMNFFYSLHNKEASVEEKVKDYLENHKLIGGFGHRIYKEEDPRAQLILKTLKDNGFNKEFIQIGLAVEEEIIKLKGKKLPMNIDGAIAVVLCTFGWDAKLAKAVFIIARTPGLCAHFLNN